MKFNWNPFTHLGIGHFEFHPKKLNFKLKILRAENVSIQRNYLENLTSENLQLFVQISVHSYSNEIQE